jgi:hypothetical protein
MISAVAFVATGRVLGLRRRRCREEDQEGAKGGGKRRRGRPRRPRSANEPGNRLLQVNQSHGCRPAGGD